MAKAVTPSRHGRVREQWRGSGRGRESEAGSRSWAEGASTASGWQGGSGNGGGDGGGGDDEGGEGSGEYDGGNESGGGGGGGDGDEATRATRGGEGAGVARAAPGVCPSGLSVQSGGLSRRSAPSDHLQAAASLSIHREFCAHSPTGAQEHAGQGGPDTCESKAPSDARAGTWLGNGRGRRVGAGQPPSARPGERCKRQASVARAINFLQAPDLAYTPKIEILHACSTNAPFASSDATHRADHYDVLRFD